MTVTGKIQKFRMREISIMELGLDGSHAGDSRPSPGAAAPATPRS
jgi:hypothetical protein